MQNNDAILNMVISKELLDQVRAIAKIIISLLHHRLE